MKSFNKLLILSLLPILFACEKVSEIVPDDVNKEQPEVVTPAVPEGRTISVSATSDGPATKTTLAETSVLWDEGDEFSIVNVGTNVVMTLSGEAGSTHGDFSGTVAEKDVIDDSARAIFPSSAFSSFVDGNITLRIPHLQKYVEGSFDHSANIMVGDVAATGTDSYSASFKNMMGVLKLSITSPGCYISTITVTDKAGKNLWGTATIPADFTDGVSVDMLSDGGSSIVIDCDGLELSMEETSFYVVVPVGAFANGFDVEVSSVKGITASKGTTKNNEISINTIKSMPAFEVDPIEVFNIENDALKLYLDKGSYSKWGASSYFEAAPFRTGIWPSYKYPYAWQDSPKSYDISLDGTANTMTFVDKTTGRTIYEERAVSGKSHSFINMTPGHRYAYIVKNAGNVVEKNMFKVEGRVRMVEISDSWNYRDLGGWTGLGGNKIQYELIYRGGSLNGVWQKKADKYSSSDLANVANYIYSDNSRQQIVDLGIMAELDLRATSTTSSDYSHAVSLGMNNTGITYLEYKQISSGNALDNDPRGDDAIVQDVKWIIGEVLADKPVAFHCKSGADRTGGVAYLILSLLGVSEGDITHEFEITNFSHENKIVKGDSTPKYREKYSSSVPQTFYSGNKSFVTLGQGNRQENAYYYLNQHFAGQGKTTVSAELLDAFIEKMLGMEPGSYQHPSFAR